MSAGPGADRADTAGAAIPLTLYLHLPWCVRKCPYCDFNSHRAGDDPPLERYVDALVADLDVEAVRAAGRPLTAIFIGGGTPSLFSGGQIGRLLDAVAGRYTLAADAEITLEANPGTVERGSFAAYRAAGVNRVSLGAQSFDDACLAALGRIHTAAETRAAVDEARRAGIDNLNLDVMFALPRQSVAGALADVSAALALAPAHISHYQLTLEPNTRFHHSPPPLPDADTAWEMQKRCHEALEAAGYRRYEVSAFARPGRECRHNLNYWEFGDYLAAGAGAHGKITDADGTVRRYAKPASPRAWMEAALAGRTGEAAAAVAAEDLVFEYTLNALRLTRGFTTSDFAARTGLGPAALEPGLAAARRRGLLEADGVGGLRPSALGMRFLNDLQALFLPSSGAAAG
ncbi:radical SAM family heme chaperone HemW [Lentisalinibacter orientalis]|uniref:radical SAM family heme chaperone HemW n=1 Tax=Lentisalinibacter orientalis TaxID=2992241 RepID=UPI00386315EE